MFKNFFTSFRISINFTNRRFAMKLAIIKAGLLILVLFFMTGCAENKADDMKKSEANSTVQKIELKEISFRSGDDLEITADLYSDGDVSRPFIILFHQAGWSRGEYRETAPVFNSMGYNCIAVDQRSGKHVNGVDNLTASRAVKDGKETAYLDAYQDMEATLKYVISERLATGKLYVIGSSYSSALGFRLAAEYPAEIDALIAFAPGEYFSKATGSESYITDFAAKVNCPVFITSAKKEKAYWEGIYKAVKSVKTSYLPFTEGNHGSRALWKKFSDNSGYWIALKDFLKGVNK